MLTDQSAISLDSALEEVIMSRLSRVRDIGIVVGDLPPGRYNSIIDVPGILVGHKTISQDLQYVARTGITVIIPREGAIWKDYAFAGYYSQNGSGEVTGLSRINKFDVLSSPIAMTNTYTLGIVRDALVAYAVEQHSCEGRLCPIVIETYDGWLNDIKAPSITKSHVYEAIKASQGSQVLEGNIGAGTGTVCYELKAGIGTSSRLIKTRSGEYTVGVLVLPNFGIRSFLAVDGLAIGRQFEAEKIPLPWKHPQYRGDFNAVIATDAPLISQQCRQLAKSAYAGMGRLGGPGNDDSSDFCLAFATGNHIPFDASKPHDLIVLPGDQLKPLIEAATEAVEEAILNSLTSAETLVGFQGHTAYAIPLDDLGRIMKVRRSSTK
jgi:D-aminopeptidase